ncbi:MAG: DNA repair protein RadC [Oscillospiraceae bacterium]|nr:DNA repair protein RadC [Oscillospiraceae bacterium]
MGVHDGHRDRLRERFLTYGLDSFEDHEIVELLLFYAIGRRDTNPLAHELVHRFGSLAGIMDASFQELLQVDGVGKQTATLLQLIKPLCREYLISQAQELSTLNTVDICAHYLIPYFFGAREEHVFLLCLDAKCRPICCREVAAGDAISSEIPLKKVAKLAIDSGAVSVILSHNHPGGDLTPSKEDYNATSLLRNMLKPMNIILADHIIICGNDYLSFARAGIFHTT